MRTACNITLDRDLMVVVLYMANVKKQWVNEELEYLIYSAIRAEAEANEPKWDLAHLDEIYGKIHNHWERLANRWLDRGSLPS